MSEYTAEERARIEAGVAIMRKRLDAIKWIRQTLKIITRPNAKAKPATWRKYKRVLTMLEGELETPTHVVGAFAQVLTIAIQGKTRPGRKMALGRCRDALNMAEAEVKGKPYEMPATAEEVTNGGNTENELRRPTGAEDLGPRARTETAEREAR